MANDESTSTKDEARRKEIEEWRTPVIEENEGKRSIEKFICAGIRYEPAPPHMRDGTSIYIDDSTNKSLHFVAPGRLPACGIRKSTKINACPPPGALRTATQ